MAVDVNLARKAGALLERSRPLTVAISAAALLVIAILDYITGYEFGFSLFYLFPIIFCAWVAGPLSGILMAGAGAALWLIIEYMGGRPYQQPISPIWNAAMRLGTFLIVARLVILAKNALELERNRSMTDPLTGIANRRSLTSELHRVRAQCARTQRPFTLAFVDIDDFKRLNDEHGHGEGDRALRLLAQTASRAIRSVDLVARIGGDEFAILLPESNRATARAVVSRCFDACTNTVRREGWNISLSVGVATFDDATLSVDAMLGRVDEIMYRGKRAGKNTIAHDEPAEEGEPEVVLSDADPP